MKILLRVCVAIAGGLLIGAGRLIPMIPADEPPTVEFPPSAAKLKAAAAAIDSLAFLAGSWRGEADGGVAEETWSPGHASGLVGCFRWLKDDGSPAMFELLTLTSEQGVIRLRLRHFSPTLIAREEKEKAITLTLSDHAKAKAHFIAEKDAGDLSGVGYEVIDFKLHITVGFVKGQNARAPLHFVLTKQGE